MSDRAISDLMRDDWNRRAREDARYYVAFGSRGQDEEGFLATAADVLKILEAQVHRLPRAPNPRAWRALEIGCGPGRLMKPLSRLFGEIHGVDVSEEMVRLARERLRDIPHAHVHAGAGAGLPQFAGEGFHFVYSYAVYQHIPSRDVVLEYMRETRRVLAPGGIFQGQFNGLPPSPEANTWSGVSFTAADIQGFTREHGLELLALEGAGTQYMWTTWRKPGPGLEPLPTGPPAIHRITNAQTSEPAVPNAGRYASLALWTVNLPPGADLNTLEITVDGIPCLGTYIGPPQAGLGQSQLRQVNAELPPGIRTGLLPVELRIDGSPLCRPSAARVIPAGPLVPRILSVTDGINIVERNRTSTGLLKAQLEEVSRPDLISATLGNRPVRDTETVCIDPRPPRYEVNFRIPDGLAPGRHPLQIRIAGRDLLPVEIEVSKLSS